MCLMLTFNAWAVKTIDILFTPIADIITTDKISTAYQTLPLITPKTVILIDIDEAITTPASNFFRITNAERRLVSNMQRRMFTYEPFREAIESFYRNAKYRLVNPHWPNLINKFKQATPYIFLLSNKFPGSFGTIKNMELLEYWRLKQLGIEPTNLKLNQQDYVKMHYTGVNDYSAVYYKGIILRGNTSPNLIMRDIMYSKDFIPEKILYISSNIRSLKEVKHLAKGRLIPFQGIKYNEVFTLKGKSDPRFITLQKRILLEKKRWLDDDQLLELLKQQSTKQQKKK